MIHPHCAHGGLHNWARWCQRLSYADGSEVRSTPDGLYYDNEGQKPVHFYRRECQNMGCDAVEIAEDLVPIGSRVIIDLGGSEALYGLRSAPRKGE